MAIFDPFWAVLGCFGLFWAVLGCFGAVLGCFGVILGLFWGVLDGRLRVPFRVNATRVIVVRSQLCLYVIMPHELCFLSLCSDDS